MTNYFVLDCSVTISWCLEDEFDKYSQDILQALTQSKALVPQLWILEVTNVLLMAKKLNRLTHADTIRFIELLDSLPIYTSDLVFSKLEIVNIARNHGLTSYDTTYLLLAMHEGQAIATKDVALIRACQDNGVPIFSSA